MLFRIPPPFLTYSGSSALMAEYDIDKLLKEFESSVSKGPELDIAMDKEIPLSEKLSDEEIEDAVAKKKEREKESALKKRIAAIRKKIEEQRKEKEEPEKKLSEDEQAAEDSKRAEIIRRLQRILQLRGAERARALETLGEEFSPDEVERLAIEYVRAAEQDEAPVEVEEKKEDVPVVQAPYAGGGTSVYAAGPEAEEKTGPYAGEPEKKIDFSAKKALEETYHVKDDTENKDVFSAEKQLEKTYGRTQTGEESGAYCETCEKCDSYKPA